MTNIESRKKNITFSDESSLSHKISKTDMDAAARGALIRLTGSTQPGRVNYSFTAQEDIAEFEKQAALFKEFRGKLKHHPEYRELSRQLDVELELMDENSGSSL